MHASEWVGGETQQVTDSHTEIDHFPHQPTQSPYVTFYHHYTDPWLGLPTSSCICRSNRFSRPRYTHTHTHTYNHVGAINITATQRVGQQQHKIGNVYSSTVPRKLSYLYVISVRRRYPRAASAAAKKNRFDQLFLLGCSCTCFPACFRFFITLCMILSFLHPACSGSAGESVLLLEVHVMAEIFGGVLRIAECGE